MCGLIFLAGLILIYVANVFAEPPLVTVEAVSKQDMGEMVQIRGVVRDPSFSDGHAFFDVAQGNASIRVAWFQAGRDVAAGETVRVIGRVELYNGALEVVADGVEVQG